MDAAGWRPMVSATAFQPRMVGSNAAALVLMAGLELQPVGAGDPPTDGSGRHRAAAHCAQREA